VCSFEVFLMCFAFLFQCNNIFTTTTKVKKKKKERKNEHDFFSIVVGVVIELL